MYKRIALLLALAGAFLSPTLWAAPPPGTWTFPVIKDAGATHPLPQGAYQPDKTTIYKVVFSVTRAEEKPGNPDDGLEPVARAVNVFASAGVPLSHLKFVAVISGAATPMALDNAHYKKQFGADNPETRVIRELTAAGVHVVVCGQAAAGFGYRDDWMNPDVTVALSALSTLAILEQQGYALIKL